MADPTESEIKSEINSFPAYGHGAIPAPSPMSFDMTLGGHSPEELNHFRFVGHSSSRLLFSTVFAVLPSEQNWTSVIYGSVEGMRGQDFEVAVIEPVHRPTRASPLPCWCNITHICDIARMLAL